MSPNLKGQREARRMKKSHFSCESHNKFALANMSTLIKSLLQAHAITKFFLHSSVVLLWREEGGENGALVKVYEDEKNGLGFHLLS